MNNRSNAHLCWRTSGPVRLQTYAIEIEYNIAITVLSASIYGDIFVEEAVLFYVLQRKAVFCCHKRLLSNCHLAYNYKRCVQPNEDARKENVLKANI